MPVARLQLASAAQLARLPTSASFAPRARPTPFRLPNPTRIASDIEVKGVDKFSRDIGSALLPFHFIES